MIIVFAVIVVISSSCIIMSVIVLLLLRLVLASLFIIIIIISSSSSSIHYYYYYYYYYLLCIICYILFIIIIIIVVIIIVFLLGAARPTPRTAGAGCDFFLVKGDIVAKSLQDLLLPVSGFWSSLGLCWFVWVCFPLSLSTAGAGPHGLQEGHHHPGLRVRPIYLYV